MKIDIDQLPAYSPWPARLLGLSPWQPKSKTEAEISREYEDEKWGPLWKRVQQERDTVTLDRVLTWFEVGVQQEFCRIGQEFFLLTATEANDRWLKLIGEALEPWLPAPALVELGCGYGNVILAQARHFGSKAGQIIGGEYTKSGMEIFSFLAAKEHMNFQAGRCDFGAPGITTIPIPEGGVIYTSYAIPYVPSLPSRFVEDLCALKPKIVFHFEPCYEHACDDTLLGLMQRRYIEVNDYNRNLITLLHESEKAGAIKIVQEMPNVYGRNALLPASFVAWQPVV